MILGELPPPPDTYETLGPHMRERLDRAEMQDIKVRDVIHHLAAYPDTHRAAQLLCLVLGLAQPRPLPAASERPC